MGGLKIQPCNPEFLQARDAIIAADNAFYSGKNKCLLWKAFAKRGMGFNATVADEVVPMDIDDEVSINGTAAGNVFSRVHSRNDTSTNGTSIENGTFEESVAENLYTDSFTLPEDCN